jgi:hypothetical protein
VKPIYVNKFDRILKENFEGLTPFLIHTLMGIDPSSITVLPAKIHRTLEREMDSLIKIRMKTSEEFLLNIEWQSTNDEEMCERMHLYSAIARITYKLPVKSILIYIGEEKLNMPAEIKGDRLFFSYQQIDLRDMDPEVFLRSNIPEEIILAVLAGRTKKGEKREVIQRIFFTLRALLAGKDAKLERIIGQFELLGELRSVQEIIKKEEQFMPVTYNLENDSRYKEGLVAGQMKAATAERRSFVVNLLKRTDHSDRKIASLANVPLDFVRKVKKENL